MNHMRLINVLQLSEMLNVKRKTIYDWVHNDKIPYYKLGRCLRFDFDEVLKWIRSKKHKGKGRVDIL